MENQTVKLKAKDVENGQPQEFEVKQANKLLKAHKSQFELDDKEWEWNGIELAKAKSKDQKEVKETPKA